MRELRRLIHSPHHLFVFEVCGRLMSFTQAAGELGVSQPAVSLTIRQLEQAVVFRPAQQEYRTVLVLPVARILLAGANPIRVGGPQRSAGEEEPGKCRAGGAASRPKPR